MRAGKRPSPKTDKKTPALGTKPGVSVYSKKAELLEDAITQMNAGKYGRSSAVLKELLALDPQNMEARRLFATLHLRLGSLLPARQAFEALANEALERQDYWLAESLLQEYLAAGPRCVPFIEKLGIVYQEKGDELAAAEEFGKAIDILLDDPDAENPSRPAQLYARIRALAPASPPAFRLASYFDAQSGELLARPATAHDELSEPSVSPVEPPDAASGASPDPVAQAEPLSGTMPWDQVAEEAPSVPPPGDHAAVADIQAAPSLPAAESLLASGDLMACEPPGNLAEPAQGLREENPCASLESGLTEVDRAPVSDTVFAASGESGSGVAPSETGADLLVEDSPDPHASDVAAAGESVASSGAIDPVTGETAFRAAIEPVAADERLAWAEEWGQPFPHDQVKEPIPAPMPWEQVQEMAVTIPPPSAGVAVEPPPTDLPVAEPPAVAALEVQGVSGTSNWPASQETEKTAPPVSAPMPWEQVQEVTVAIPPADMASGGNSRTDSSVATESPSFVLSDAHQVEPAGMSVPAWTASETASITPDELRGGPSQEVSPPSQADGKPALAEEAIAHSPAQPEEVPPSPIAEPVSVPAAWEPTQDSPADSAGSFQEPVNRETSLPEPPVAPAAQLSETDQPHWPSEQPGGGSVPGAAEAPAAVSNPAADSVAPPEHPPAPERTEKPKNTGFSWESIFSTWKYGPSSTTARPKGHQVAPGGRFQTGAPLPTAEPVAPPIVCERASPADPEMPVLDAPPVHAIQPEPVASPMVSEQVQEISVTISTAESLEPDLATAKASVSASDVAEGLPHPLPLSDQPGATGPLLPAMAEASEPVQVAHSLALSSSELLTQPEEFRFVAAGEVAAAAPEEAPASPEGVGPGPVSSEPSVQPEEFRFVAAGEVTAAAPVEEPASSEVFSSGSVSPEPPVQPEEFRFVAAGEMAAATPEEESTSSEVFSHAGVNSGPAVQPEELRTASSNEATVSVPAGETGRFDSPCPVSIGAEPLEQSDEFRPGSSDHVASLPPVPATATVMVPSAGEKALDAGALVPPVLTHEILPVLQPPVDQVPEEATDSPVAAPTPEIIEPVPASEVVEIVQALTPVTFAPASEPSGRATEAAPISLQETEAPIHCKTDEAFVQPTHSGETLKGGMDETPVMLPVAPPFEAARSEPALASQDLPASADPVAPESQPQLREESREWAGTGESIRFTDFQDPPTSRGAAVSGESGDPAVSSAVSAVDALFQSSGRMTPPSASERTTVAQPRPRTGSTLTRLRLGLFSFIGSCFSTTHALIMSLVGLAVLAGALAAIAVGAVGGAWVIMEEKPSAAFHSLTAAPQRSSMESRKNGYWLLLGFDAEAGDDPIQAGQERKPGANEDDGVSVCLGGTDGRSGMGPRNAGASVAEGWFQSSNPVAQFRANAGSVKDWTGQTQSAMDRYRQWRKMPFEDWGYGQAVAPACAPILYVHRLYVAEGFAGGSQADTGISRLQDDLEAWRTVLGQAKTLPVKMLAVQAIRDDLAVASGLLAQPDFDSQSLSTLTNLVRPLDQVESSMRWPMQSELAAAGQAADAQLKEERGEDRPWYVTVSGWLPLPKQRRLNEYAAYYDASSKAAGEGRYSAMPKRAAYIKNPPASVMDYLVNPIENIMGVKPLPSWDLYNGMVIDTDAHLRLASLQAWLRRGSQEGDVVTRMAKAGQRLYDPYTGLPMLVNLKRGLIYSVGHDGKDQNADPRQDVVVSIPSNSPPQGTVKQTPKTK